MQSETKKAGSGMTVSACLWLGLFPLLQFGSFHTITRDKWICMFFLASLTAAGFLVDLRMRRVSRPRLLPLLFGVGLLLWTVLSCLLSPYPGAPWWTGTGRREGLASQLCYLGLFFLFSFSRVRREPVLVSAGCGVLVFLVVVLLQRAGKNPFGLYPVGYSYETAPQFQGTIGNVDMCSGYLVIVCGLFLSSLIHTLYGLFRRPDREQANREPGAEHVALRMVIQAVFLLLVLSVSVWMLFAFKVDSGLLALTVMLFWMLMRLLPKRYRLPALILLLALMLTVVWFWSGQAGPVWELHEILRGRLQSSFGSGRVGLWSCTTAMLAEEGHLLTGTGADTFAARFSDYLIRYEMTHPHNEFSADYYDTPHSEYLAMVVNCGIPALLCFLALILAGCFGVSVWKNSVLGYAVQALLSFSVCIVAPMFWVVLGLALSRFSPPKAE